MGAWISCAQPIIVILFSSSTSGSSSSTDLFYIYFCWFRFIFSYSSRACYLGIQFPLSWRILEADDSDGKVKSVSSIPPKTTNRSSCGIQKSTSNVNHSYRGGSYFLCWLTLTGSSTLCCDLASPIIVFPILQPREARGGVYGDGRSYCGWCRPRWWMKTMLILMSR